MIVEHQATHELVAGRCFQLAQTRKISTVQRRGRFNFNADNSALLVLQHEIHLVAVLGSEVGERHSRITPTDQLAQFRAHKALEQGAEPARIGLRRDRAEAAKRGKQSTVEEMVLRGLDQARYAVAEPRRQSIDQEHALKCLDVARYRRPRDLERRCHVGVIRQLAGLLRKKPNQQRQLFKLVDCGNIAHVPVEGQSEVIVEPLNAAALVLAPAVQPFSLLIHELATNAVKHGALSVQAGKIDVDWRFSGNDHLLFEWVEHGGPPAIAQPSHGFGMSLMSTVVRQLGGTLDLSWGTDGIRVAAQLPSANYRQAANTDNLAHVVSPGEEACRVLIVEDELLVGMEMAKALQEEGWEVVGPVGTLEEAFSILADGPALNAAVLDINLNGQLVYPVADLLRTRGIPYLFCTGYDGLEPDKRHGEHPIVQKPTNLRLLIESVRVLCCDMPPGPGDRRAA